MSIYKDVAKERPTAEVFAVGQLGFDGNVIPHTWREHLRREDKRTKTGTAVDLEATVTLAWIVYWYRPANIIDERTKTVLGWKKKFWGDKLQASYDHIADETGLTKLQVKGAMDRLEERKIVSREFRHTRAASNILYIGIDVDKIKAISFPQETILSIYEGSSPVSIGDDVQYLLGTYTETTDTETTTEEERSSLFAQVDDPHPPAAPASSGKKDRAAPKGNNPRVFTDDTESVPGSSHAEMFAALADLCKVDPNLVNGRLGAHVKSLRKAGYTVADLERFGQWWYANDFRGKRGEPPTMGSVATDLPRSVAPTPLPVAPPDNQPHVDSLRSWHRTQQNAAWGSHIAAQRGTYPSDAKGYLEWYEEEYGSLGEDELRRLWREYKQEQESE